MKKTLIFLCLVAYYFLPIASYASNDDHKSLAQQKAQQAINACWAISQEDRDSINTNRQRAGILDSALCMEKHIIELSEKYLFPESPSLVSETKKNLEEIRSGYGRLYWNLYNSLDGCYSEKHGWRCGTENHTVHNSAYARLLEKIIINCYEQIEEYQLD